MGALVPWIGFPRCKRDRLPARIAGGQRASIDVAIDLRPCRNRQGFVDLGLRRPQVFQVNRLAGGRRAERLAVEIDVDRAGERKGHHQRRAREKRGAHRGMNAGFEVAVAGEHRTGDAFVVEDRFFKCGIDGTGCPEAGAAAIAGDSEAKRVERGLQPAGVEIFAHDPRSWSERGLDPTLRLQPECNRSFGDQPRGHHHARIGCIGAGRDRRDHHVAMGHLVWSAIAGVVRGIVSAGVVVRRWRQPVTAGAHRLRQKFVERVAYPRQWNTVLRPLRTGDIRNHRSKIEIDRRRIIDRAGNRRTKAPLGTEELFDAADLGGRASRLRQITAGLLVDGKIADGRAILRRHVGNRGTIGNREVFHALAEELNKLAHHLGAAEHFGDVQHEIGRGHARLQLAGHIHPNDVWRQEIDRLTQGRRLGLDAADAPADHAEARDHAGMRIRSDQRIGKAHAVLDQKSVGEEFEIDLVQDAGAGREQPECRDRPASPI